MNKQIKTRVSADEFVAVTMNGQKYVVTLSPWSHKNRLAPVVFDSNDKRIPYSDKRYAALVRIALSAYYRVNLTV